MLPLTTGKLLELWNQTPKRIISLFPIQQGTPTSWARSPRNSSAAERFHTRRFGKSLQKQLSVLRRSSPSQANDFRGSIRGCQVHVHHFGVLCDRNGSASAPFHETKAWTGEWQRWLSKVCLCSPSSLLVVAKKFKIRVFELVKNFYFGYLFTIFHTEPLSAELISIHCSQINIFSCIDNLVFFECFWRITVKIFYFTHKLFRLLWWNIQFVLKNVQFAINFQLKIWERLVHSGLVDSQ